MKENIKEIVNNEKVKKISQIFYLIGIVFFCLKFFSEKCALFVINDNIFAIILCFCFFQKMLIQGYTKKQLCITLISGIICTYVGFITKEYIIFYLYLAIFSSKNVDIKKIIKVCFWTILTLLSICTIIYTVKLLIGNDVPIVYRNDGSARYTFYLNHPNMYAGVILWLSAMVLYLKYYNMKIRDYVMIFVVNIFTFMLTDSRTSLISFALLIVLFIISKKCKENNKYYKMIAKYSFLVMGIITILLAIWYLINKNNVIINNLNEFFSQRIFLLGAAIEKYGISILPRAIDLTEKIRWESGAIRELYIDSIYARAFIKYGIAYLIYLFYFCTNLINKKTTNREIPFVILFAIVGMMEKYIIFPVIGFSLFFYKFALWDENNLDEREEKIKRLD